MPTRRAPWLPPRWFVRLFWHAHRGVYRVTRGHVGLWRPRGDRWVNVQADPAVTIDTGDGARPARVHAAQGDERARLWARWQEVDKSLDGSAARRPSETAVVVIEPQPVP